MAKLNTGPVLGGPLSFPPIPGTGSRLPADSYCFLRAWASSAWPWPRVPGHSGGRGEISSGGLRMPAGWAEGPGIGRRSRRPHENPALRASPGPSRARTAPPCILGTPWAGGVGQGGQPAGAEHTRSGHRPGRPHCHWLPRAEGKAPLTCVLSAQHRAGQSPIPHQERRQEAWGACLGTECNADTQRLLVCRRKVTSWSPGRARLRGTSGQVPGQLAPAGSSCRKLLPLGRLALPRR